MTEFFAATGDNYDHQTKFNPDLIMEMLRPLSCVMTVTTTDVSLVDSTSSGVKTAIKLFAIDSSCKHCLTPHACIIITFTSDQYTLTFPI